jgi:hypothetical protein
MRATERYEGGRSVGLTRRYSIISPKLPGNALTYQIGRTHTPLVQLVHPSILLPPTPNSLAFPFFQVTRNHAADAHRRPRPANKTQQQATRPHAPAPRLISAQLPMSTLSLYFLPYHVPLLHQHVYWSFVLWSTLCRIHHLSLFPIPNRSTSVLA